MDSCDECGNKRVRPSELEGVAVGVCDLCGHVQGDAGAVARARELADAAERGIDPAVFPLVQALEAIPTFRVAASSPGRPRRGEYPFVFLRVEASGLKDVERLLTSLEMANRHTTRRWVVELTLQRGLLFILRPRFWKPVLDISDQDIAEARGDLPLLAKAIERDVNLGWWRE
jgi:hypothetical protein